MTTLHSSNPPLPVASESWGRRHRKGRLGILWTLSLILNFKRILGGGDRGEPLVFLSVLWNFQRKAQFYSLILAPQHWACGGGHHPTMEVKRQLHSPAIPCSGEPKRQTLGPKFGASFLQESRVSAQPTLPHAF